MSTSPPPAGTRAVLEACLGIEVECGRLYGLFALAHTHDPKIQALWRKTAKEEANHADQVRLALKLDGSIDGTHVALEDARAMLDEMKRLVATVRRQVPTVPEALKLAIELEQKLDAFHLAQAAAFASGSQRSLFEAMMRSDDHHVAQLEAAYATFAPARTRAATVRPPGAKTVPPPSPKTVPPPGLGTAPPPGLGTAPPGRKTGSPP
jgi:rubrerythrin